MGWPRWNPAIGWGLGLIAAAGVALCVFATHEMILLVLFRLGLFAAGVALCVVIMGWPRWNPAIGWGLGLIAAAGVALCVFFATHEMILLVLFRLGLFAAVVALYVVISCVAERFRDAWPRERLDNGIRVGAPKVYDNRSLALMIEQLEKQLQAVKSIDEGTLKSAIGTQQGERRTDWTGTLDAVISAPPNTNAASAKGKPAAESGSGKPASAAPKDLPSLPSDASPFKWSEPARYLLSEQVSLYYEIFNLRLLLERALSDRLWGGKTRLQAVIGVPISLDPPPYTSGCAATVELKIATNASLVALFPQQETFNTWGVDRRRFQLSAAGSAEKASGSGTLQAARQTSFLRRHAEVVAMERESGRDELVVAWQFRPAPGARTVAPGLRQMLMVIALPVADTGDASITMKLFVRSSWQKWREHSETAGSGPGWHAILSKRTTHYDEWGTHGSFKVPTTEFVERSLAPVIDSIEWARIGAAKAAIIVKGKNFFTGTTVLLGDEIIDAEHGLTIKSERSIQVIAPLESLTRDAVLSGRYGPSFRLLKPRDATLHPMHITDVRFDPSPSGDSFAIKLSLSTRNQQPVNWEVFNKLEDPIFCVNRKLVPDLLVFDPGPNAAGSVQASVRVTGEFLPKGSALFILRWPFLGDDWSLHYQTYYPGINVSAFRFDAGGGHTGLLFSGAPFDDGVIVVVLDRSYSITQDGPLSRLGLAGDLLKLKLSADLINSHCECFICQPGAASLPVAIPDAPPAAEPSVDTSKRPPLLEPKTAATVDLMGAGLEKVVRATLNGTPLLFQSYAGGASAFVVIEGKAVPSEGKHAILLETQSGKELSAPILIKPRPEPKNGH